MKFQIFRAAYTGSNKYTVYFFTYGNKWSSDFDFPEQLIDIGLADTGIQVNPKLKYYYPEELAEELTNEVCIVKYLCSVNNLEDMYEACPAVFI